MPSPATPRAPGSTPPPVGNGWAPTQLIARAPTGGGATAGNALPQGTRLGEFELLQVLGEGGFGIVYLANDHTLRRRVAVKEYMPSTLAERGADLHVLVPDERRRGIYIAGLTGFVNEARLLAQFDHPSLVKVHRFWQANGTAYMVMPYYQGITLRQALRQMNGPPDEPWLMALLAELTGALAVIHNERCFHRDIAPDNIMLLADGGKPLLLDFGAARQVIGDATQQLTAILKPGYAPIEQYAEVASMKQGPWTDIYALCAVVYAAITGAKPPVAVGRSVNDSLVPLARAAAGRYSPGFLQAIDRGLRLRPEERQPTMLALRRDLGLEPGFRPDVTPEPPSKPGSPAFPPTKILPRRLPEVHLERVQLHPGPVVAPIPMPVLPLGKVPTLAAATRPDRAGKPVQSPPKAAPQSLARIGKIWAATAVSALAILVTAVVWWIADGRTVHSEAASTQTALPATSTPK